MLTTLDIAVVVGWLLFTFLIGLVFAKRAGRSSDDFFVAGRSLPWWVVGTSMVATTFAADTPLVISGLAAKGVYANWFWWVFGLQGMAAVFFFARLWRRSGVVTDAELVELRYGGRMGALVRGVKAVWFGVFFNVLVIAWVMKAMTKLLGTLFDLDAFAVWGLSGDAVVVLTLFVLTAIYTQAAGLWGVVVTDVVQFVAAMGAAVALAVVAWVNVGGRAGLDAGLAARGLDLTALSALTPSDFDVPDGSFAGLVAILGVMWWGQHNIDGGGYLAQRLLAAKDEAHATWAYLWFTVAHLCLRPWPWIVVGLVGLSVVGPVDDPETLYPRMMRLYLPSGAFGIMLASFLAAFMSTIDTQLHWGASLAVNDVWRRFVRRGGSEREVVWVSRAAVLLLAALGGVVSFTIADIGTAWKLAISVTAGVGTVYAARWLWWRVTAWCELSAMGVAAGATGVFALLAAHHPDKVLEGAMGWSWLGAVPSGWLGFPFTAAASTVLVLVVWVPVAFLTSRRADRAHLRAFWDRVRPPGPGWRAIVGDQPTEGLGGPALGWLGGVVAVYAVLFFVGHALFGRWGLATLDAVVGVIGGVVMARAVRRLGGTPATPEGARA